MIKMGGGNYSEKYKVGYTASQYEFNNYLFKILGIEDNLLYGIIYPSDDEFNQRREDYCCLGKNLLSTIKKSNEDITIRGPVKIVGENQ